jgi:transketolase
MTMADPLPEAGSTTHAEMANAIRALAMDAVQAAKSGHPGMPMGMADVATVLFNRFLRFDAARPDWPDRDRFVLSAGHGSMLLYALLYLTGYEEMTIDELRNFRQLGSLTPGHPEFDHTPGVETTTGPLGQGIATAVGMALAERLLNARHGDAIVGHHTWVIASDGDLMEGLSHEAVSLAGHLRLGKLIVLFDDNQITIDGPTGLSVSDDQIARFQACGWDTARVDGHDADAIARAMETARGSDKPSLIACRTTIGFGAPTKAGTAAAHGAPLGDDEIAGARERLGWAHAPFEVPEAILASWRAAGARGAETSAAWDAALAGLDAETRGDFNRALEGRLPSATGEAVSALKKRLAAEQPTVASRKASEIALETLTAAVPEMIGGSADLTGSNNTRPKDMAVASAGDFSGRYLHYGIREHAMAAAMNGMAVHGGIIPYGGTFMVFTDYCRPAIRLAALMGLRVIYVMTHDSIGLGEDGPTHQPIEHLASLRAMPNLNVFRPADAIETAECWQLALEAGRTPSVIALSRQGLPTVRMEHTDDNLSARGAYVLMDASGEAGGEARVTLIATGSEVGLAIAAREALEGDGVPTRVVSMPCQELFDAQDAAYRDAVLGTGTVRIAVEAASTYGWERYVGTNGAVIGMTGFGASAPAKALYTHFGITAEAIVEAARARL